MRSSLITKSIIWFVAVILLGSNTLGLAVAADKPGSILKLEMHPSVIELLTEPGKPVKAEVKIKNSGISPERLSTQLQTFGAKGENGQPELYDRTDADEYLDWVTVSPQSFTLQPDEQRVVSVTVKPPASAQFGYYFTVTFLRDTPKGTPDEPSAALTGGTAALFLLNVQVPNAVRSMEILEFSTPKTVYEYLPTKFSIRVRNSGNVHLAPQGAIFIRDAADNKVDTVDFNESGGNVLPDSNRLFSPEWKEGFPVLSDKKKDGELVLDKTGGGAVQTLSWDVSKVNKFRIGKYTARLVLVYNDGIRDIPLEAFVSFWVLPWKFMLAGLVVLIFVLLGIRSTLAPLFLRWKSTRVIRKRRFK